MAKLPKLNRMDTNKMFDVLSISSRSNPNKREDDKIVTPEEGHSSDSEDEDEEEKDEARTSKGTRTFDSWCFKGP